MIGPISFSTDAKDPVKVPTREGSYDPTLDLSGKERHIDFLDVNDIGSLSNSHFNDEKDRIEPDLTFNEDAELLSDGSNMIATNNWTLHDVNNVGAFTVAGNHPYNAETPNTLKQTTSNTEQPFTVLSGLMDLKKIVMSFYILSTLVDVQDLWATRVSFIGTNTTNTTDYDTALSVGIKDTDAYAYNGQMVRISTQASSSQWYSYIIEVDCITQKANISYYRGFFDSRVSYVENLPLFGNFQSIQRIELMVQKRVTSNVQTFYDNIKILDTSDDLHAITPLIELPTGMEWQTLALDYTSWSTDSHMSYELIDGTGHIITGLSWDRYFTNVDLQLLNEKGIQKMRIKGIFNWDSFTDLGWNGYSLDWVSKKGWRDTFLTTDLIGTLSGCRIYNNNITLTPGQENGYCISRKITIPANHYWEELFVDKIVYDNTFVIIDLVDSDTGRSIPGFHNMTDWKIDLSKLDPLEYPTIKIRSWLSSSEGNIVRLCSVGLTWYTNTDPVVRDLHYETSVLRTRPVHFYVNVSDENDDGDELTVVIEYKEPFGDRWVSDLITDMHYDYIEDIWVLEFLPPANATIGNYSFKLEIRDRLGAELTEYLPSDVQVLNNKPTVPEVELGPLIPKGFLYITASIKTRSEDVEGESLTYNYSFFVNGAEIVEERRSGVYYTDVQTLEEEYFNKLDEVSCKVHSFDGQDESDAFVTSFVIMNDPPRVADDYNLNIELVEDSPALWERNLKDIVYDLDLDVLSYNYSTDLDLQLEINGTAGTLFFIPAENFTGDGPVTVNVTDGEENTSFEIQVVMIPCKDPPAGRIIYPDPGARFLVGEPIRLEAEVWDSDTEEQYLLVEWLIAGSTVATGANTTISLNETGNYILECVADGLDSQTVIGRFNIEIYNNPPAYSSVEVSKEYDGSSSPVLLDIVDMYGNGENASNRDTGWINLTGLRSWDEEETVFIELSLSQPPVLNSLVPQGLGEGEWSMIRVYLVRSTFSEPEFNQSLLNFYSNPFTSPGEERCYELREGLLCLSLGVDCPFEYEIVGDSIVWNISMDDLLAAGVQNDDFNLFASSVHIRSENGKVLYCFDTIGHGSREHKVITKEVEPIEKEDNGSGHFWILLIILLVIVILIIAAVLGYFFLGKGKGPVEQEAVNEEKEGTVEGKIEGEQTTGVQQVPPNAVKPSVGSGPVGSQVPPATP
ncbi:MAG: hypothetical protein JXA22_10040 [Candidatus Thermoplasmatota archaeon]|nr:hypothetical protein [Candidatus Thermoplasmatota archaeon]